MIVNYRGFYQDLLTVVKDFPTMVVDALPLQINLTSCLKTLFENMAFEKFVFNLATL